MAQTKTNNPKASKAKPASSSKSSSSRSRSRSRKAKASSSKPANSRSSGSNGAQRASSAKNGHGSKAALPLIAGGAALAGTVGGVLLGASRSGHKVLGVHLPGQKKRVKFKLKSSDFASAAKNVGRFGENVGDLAAELKKTREGLAGDNKHASPVEVLLRGLTTRR